MITRIISLFICATALTQSALSQSLLDSVQHLSQMEKTSGGLDPKAYIETTNQALSAWEKASENEKFASLLACFWFISGDLRSWHLPTTSRKPLLN